MNTRQYELYKFLKENYADGKYISKKEICDGLPQFYAYDENTNRHNVDIEQDIRVINDWENMQKCIVSNKRGYKIGNEEECNEYLHRRFNSIFKSLKSLNNIKKRLEQNGQFRLVFGKEREIMECFINGTNKAD